MPHSFRSEVHSALGANRTEPLWSKAPRRTWTGPAPGLRGAWKVFLGGPHRGRLPGIARSARLDGKEVRPMGRRQAPGSAELRTRKALQQFTRCLCGEVFAMYGPGEAVRHVSHLSVAERARSSAGRQFFRR
jgi:hypothetical protein